MSKKYVVRGLGWFLVFRSEAEADQYCLHVRRKYGDMVWVERYDPRAVN
jgi:hypothetical protein